ncbi:hypothetical protein CBR_g34016 [Chara braunii]|uniref:DUF659 domain-containing protein n=1 Tax=Chara braunii TaxID=69332 RepID=A0A388LHW1_CHABU|nr:hypothetical protein CBR_g34016 [Chara braunii]|eukprot:GBG81835.1 hypothetical protein CBR_g34016 [Chara braunii]
MQACSRGKSETAHVELRKKNKVWIWCEQGQEVGTSKGRGEYWVRCRLCSTIWRGLANKATEHFLKPMNPCALRTGEVVHSLVSAGAKVQPSDKNTKYLLRNYKGGEVESDVVRCRASCGEEGLEDPQTDEPQPPPVAGWAVAGIAKVVVAALGEAVGGGGAAEGGGGDEGQGLTARRTALRQTTVQRWVDSAAQKKLDRVEAMFRAGIAFDFLNMDTTQTLHAVYLEIANSRPKVKLPSYNYMRTIMLDIIYMTIQREVNLLTACWDLTGCMFITDGSTDHWNRPATDFLAAGEQRAVLVATVTMSVRFGFVYQMLQRLADIEDVLIEMVDGRSAGKWRALRWSGEKLHRRADLMYYTVRSEFWWPQVRKIVSIMHRIFQLLKRMDAEGTPPTNLVEYADMIGRKLTNVVLTKKEREDVMDKVHDHVQMMRQPVHAAAFVLDPWRRNEHWLFDQNNVVTQNAMRFFLGRSRQNDGSTLVGNAEDVVEKEDEDAAETVDEEMRQRNMAKARKGRIPQNLDDSHMSDSSDLEDIVWKGKCWNESLKDCSEDEDSDFELSVVPAVPATTYVGRRTRRQDRDLEVKPAPVVERVDTDVEFFLHHHDDPDEEEATRAKEMADRDRELVDRRVAEEACCAAILTRRERARCAAQQEKRAGEALKDVDGDVDPAMEKGEQQQEEPADAEEEQHAAGAVYMRRPRPWVEPQVGAEEETTNQHVAISERVQEQQDEHQAAENIATPPFPEMNDALHHHNLWKSRAGRKRKAAVEESPKAPQRGTRRPKKKKAVEKTPPQLGRRKTMARKKPIISDDDLDSDASPPQSSDGGIDTCKSD